MDIRLYFPPRPGFPPSTVMVTGIPDEADKGGVETLARKVLEAGALTPYMGRVGWEQIEGAGARLGMAAAAPKAKPRAAKAAARKKPGKKRGA